MHILRKFSSIGVAGLALGFLAPIATIGVVAGVAGTASAATILSCGVSSTVTFASPGISTDGTETTATTGTTNVSASTITGCGTSSMGALVIHETNGSAGTHYGITCTSAGHGTGPLTSTNDPGHSTLWNKGPFTKCTAAGHYVIDTASEFEDGGAATILSGLPNITGIELDGHTGIEIHTTHAVAVVGAPCTAPIQAGFNISGTVTSAGTYHGDSTELLACLVADHGPNTTGSFSANLNQEIENHTTIVISSATIGGNSKLVISS